jgi:hypothetical protein
VLALELDQAAYQVARANEPGKYVGLGVLLSILEKVGLDPAWERFLRGPRACPTDQPRRTP